VMSERSTVIGSISKTNDDNALISQVGVLNLSYFQSTYSGRKWQEEKFPVCNLVNGQQVRIGFPLK
jgi:hypothetical protein